MNVIICAVQVPFVRGGAEVLVEGLRDALVERGHEVAVVALPFNWNPKVDVLRSALAWRFLDVSESNGKPVDLVISTKFPSYMVKHLNKVTWLVHQHRQAYDWYGSAYSDFVNNDEDNRLRKAIHRMDKVGLTESKRVFTISRNVAGRLSRFLGLFGTPLYPPTREIGFHEGDLGDYALYVGRLDRAKRPDLLIRSIARARGPVRAVLAGTGPEERALRNLAEELGVEDRVDFAGFVEDGRLADLYANCLCVFYTPVDEDYGYTTVEAFRSGKAVVTTADAGGVLEFVRDGETGFVTRPDPGELARCLDSAVEAREQCVEMGRRGAALVSDITWDAVVRRLVE